MKKTAFLVSIAASGAALLFIAAAAKCPWHVQPSLDLVQGQKAALWFGVFIVFAVFAAAMTEYYIHGRRTFLYLGAGFLAAGIMDIWMALVLPGSIQGMQESGAMMAVWHAGRITLAGALLYGIFIHRKHTPAGRMNAEAALVTAISVLWAAVVIFAASVFPIDKLLAPKNASVLIGYACGAMFATEYIGYGRRSVHRGNAVLAWTSYGLIFAVFGQVAVALQSPPSELLFSFANAMKVVGYVVPLAGVLAEHVQMQERLRKQASALQGLICMQQTAASVTEPPELYQSVVDLVSSNFKADAVALLPYSAEHNLLTAAAQVGLEEEVVENLVFRPSEGPVGEAMSKQETVFVQNIAADASLVSKLGGTTAAESMLCIPLVAKDQCVGVLCLFFHAGHRAGPPPKELLRVLGAYASQAALALEGIQTHGRTAESLKLCREHAKDLGIVWDIGMAISAKLELHALVDTLVDRLKDAVAADACSVLILDPETDDLKIMGQRRLRRYQAVVDHVDECDALASTVARTGQPAAVANVPNSTNCKYPELANQDGGTHHLLSVPMSWPGMIGAINVFRQNREPFGERETRLLTRLASIVAVGIRNAEMYEHQRDIAKSLHETFLPALPTPGGFPGIEIRYCYHAGLDESSVGGDFYDVVELGDARYGISIGDVAGKGLNAAVYTAMSRYMIQAYSAEDPDPASVVSRLNGALCRYTPAGKFVTLVYGVLDVKAGEFTYVNAGHEYPFLYNSQDGVLSTLDTTGPAAGALLDAEYQTGRMPVKPGDILVFYTDGATEARSARKFLGTEGLKEIVLDCIRETAESLPDAVFERINSFAQGHLRDDVAILVIKSVRGATGGLF